MSLIIVFLPPPLPENKIDGVVDDICFKISNDRGIAFADDEPKVLKKGQMGVLRVSTKEPVEIAVRMREVEAGVGGGRGSIPWVGYPTLTRPVARNQCVSQRWQNIQPSEGL